MTPIQILVFGIDSDLLFLAAHYLDGPGRIVMTCNDGEQALKLAQQHPFDVIFVEIMPPYKECIPFLETITRLNPHLAAVAVSSYGDEPLRQELEKKGASYCIFDGYSKSTYEQALYATLL